MSTRESPSVPVTFMARLIGSGSRFLLGAPKRLSPPISTVEMPRLLISEVYRAQKLKTSSPSGREEFVSMIAERDHKDGSIGRPTSTCQVILLIFSEKREGYVCMCVCACVRALSSEREGPEH